jgi:16S rRNA (cytidine1402-2'-O)-methyltransferase
MLYILSTPIGNMGDISLRAVETLKESDFIIAEDTRRIGMLLKRFDIPKKRIISYNDHNKKRRIPGIIEMLKSGNDAALVSDAGTPGISDPGYSLIAAAITEGIEICPIPGANAALCALVASGLATDSFVFLGFLPKTEGKKRKILEEIRESKRTHIFYESPYRIEKTLKLMAEVMPDAYVCAAREMTKRFEEFIRGKPQEALKRVKSKGEFTIVVNCGKSRS